MQVGEPVSVAPPPAPPEDKDFAAELVSITFKSSIKTSHSKATVAGPHWEAGKEAEITDDWQAMAKKMGLPAEPYSKRAATYLVKGAGGSHDIEVKIKVTKSKNVSGDAKLVGNFSGLVIEGACPTGAGEHTVTAKFLEPPEDIHGYRGKIGWGLEVPSAGMTVSLGTTLAEVYFILGKPTSPYAKGAWVEALRFLCGKVGVTGEKEDKEVAAKVTSYCHSRHGLRYDTERGRPRYGVSNLGGTFRLQKYMEREIESCNCYDQAGAVQALVGALGVSTIWLFLNPFGYIKPTMLVGVGLCNNPFFEDESLKLVPFDSPDRNGFGNHAFVGTPTGKILDACAGPHTGSEGPEQYVKASIDDTPSLYGSDFQPGRPSEIVPGLGVKVVL